MWVQVGFEYVVMTSHAVYDDCICVGYVYRRVIGRERVARYGRACVRIYMYLVAIIKYTEIIFLVILWIVSQYNETSSNCHTVRLSVCCMWSRTRRDKQQQSWFVLSLLFTCIRYICLRHLHQRTNANDDLLWRLFVLLTKSSDEKKKNLKISIDKEKKNESTSHSNSSYHIHLHEGNMTKISDLNYHEMAFIILHHCN